MGARVEAVGDFALPHDGTYARAVRNGAADGRRKRALAERGDQIDSRRAFAAACRRSLTSASSRAARSMRSCWVSERSCWMSARSCWLSACSRKCLELARQPLHGSS